MNETIESTQATAAGGKHGLNSAVAILDKVGVFSRWTNVIGIFALVCMVALTFVDVIMRYIFNAPIIGVQELVEVIMICAIFLAVAHTHNTRSHISVDLISNRLSEKPRAALEFITNLLSLGLFGIIMWRTLVYAIYVIQDNRLHDKYWGIPNGPFAIVIFIGCTSLFILLIRDLLTRINDSSKLGLNWRYWLAIIGIPIIFVVFAYFWMQPDLWDINLTIVGVIGVLFSLILFLTGMPVAYALILTSFIFIGHIRSPETAFVMIGTEMYRNSGSYNWSVLPFFVTRGFIALLARFGEDLSFSAFQWIGHIRASVWVATIGACTAFAAIVGDSVASTATMGSVALPQMKKYKYDERLTAGSICSGATLGPIIPPSTAFIIVGLLTGLSIGDLFIAGIIPGLVMAGCFIIAIFIWNRRNPNIGPPGEKSDWKSRIISLRAGGPVLLLFLLVIGGIYWGVFTPTEGGSIGAVGAFIIGLVMGRFRWTNIVQMLQEAGKVISMTFIILIGSVMFTRFAAWCNLSNSLQETILGLNLAPMQFLALTMFALLILGFFIDLAPLLLIGIPLLFPTAKAIGIDPIHFCVLATIVINLGALTPPVGINLFVLKGIAKELPISKIYAGVWPFVGAALIAIIILFFIPSLTTWLPSTLR
ncbi:MAG: TRAP transporter large permease subunit [Dehalococcoidales bacterium]|nr:TRAP transporter large permease subunit [Dehalococcoidales bacterium]